MSNFSAMQTKLNSDLKAITGAERTFRPKMISFSREVLLYVIDSNDIGMVNRILSPDVLTPANLRLAQLFFPTFIPWEFDAEKGQFGKRFDDKGKVLKYRTKCEGKLNEPDFNIFTWGKKNTSTEKKPTDYARNLERTLKAGFAAVGDNKLTASKLAAALVGANVPLDKLMKAITALAED